MGLGASLPLDLAALRSWQAPPSLLVDSSGAPITQFALVQPVADGPPSPTMLAEAFLAAAPQAFYEPRVDAATSLPGALLRVVRGQASSASPLSLALARALLLDEPPGAERQAREELLATALEGTTTVTDRVEAWMNWVPLCRGRRGLERARRECLGTGERGWGDGEMALLAAAAAWGLDLDGDPHLLAARRDAVLEQLARRGLVDAASARRGGPPPHRAPPPTRDCLPELLAQARRTASSSPATPVRLDSGLDGGVRALLDQYGVRSALLADPRDGVVRACRSGDLETLEAATMARLVAGGGRTPGLKWLPDSDPSPEPAAIPRLEAWNSMLAMTDAGGLRWSLRGDRLLLVHPALAGAASLSDPTQAPGLVEALGRLLPSSRAPLPDDLEVVRSPEGDRVRPRAG